MNKFLHSSNLRMEAMRREMEQSLDPTTRSKQQERAERILDAAADLLLRWGYKRVTIDDIARQTGVGTGTIYLHWKTREALFETLMLREAVAVWRALLERMKADPMEVLISRMLRSALLVVMSRPLARALFTGDSELLGKLAQGSLVQQTRKMSPKPEFLVMLRNMGLLRSDMSLPMQEYALGATVTGFYFADPMIAHEDQTPLEEKADALAQVVRLAFEPETPPSLATLQEVIVPQMQQYLEQICSYCEQQMQERMLSS
jgi:AcrR family transcriptional regulator